MAQITILYDNIISSVRSHLSVIGKRAYDGTGKNIFSDITVSSAELPIFKQYISEAIQNIAVMSADFLSVLSITDNSTTLEVEHPRWGVISSAFNSSLKSYCVAYTVADFLAMIQPDAAQKYFPEAERRQNAIINILYHKAAPTAPSQSYNTISGTVE